MENETETSDLEKSQSEGSIRSIRSPSILSSRRTKTPFEVVEIVIGKGIYLENNVCGNINIVDKSMLVTL